MLEKIRLKPQSWFQITRILNFEEKGLLIDCLIFLQINGGIFPEDNERLRSALSITKTQFHRLWPFIDPYITYQGEKVTTSHLYRISNKDKKQSARRKLNRAVKNGIVKKLSCFVCHSKKSEAHHFDYEKPLEVIWLCKKHHSDVHRIKK